jgi:hypothetical protein
MKDSADTDLISRVEKLERQNRRLKRIGCALLFLAGTIFWMGQAAKINISKGLDSRKFTLRDTKGKKRAELGITLGRPVLAFFDEQEQPTVSVGANEEGSGIILYGAGEKPQAALTMNENAPVLSMYAANGVKRLNLSVTPQGPAIGLLGSKGEAKGAFGVTADQNTYFQLFGRDEHGGVQMFSAADRAVLRFFDLNDRPRAVLGMLENEGAGLTLNDKDGNARAILMQTAKGWGLDFLDPNKGIFWRAP